MTDEVITTAAAERQAVTDMIRVWEDVLGIGGVTADDSFFELGGHSLLAEALVLAVAERFGTDVSIRTLFDHPRLAEFTAAARGPSSRRAVEPPGPAVPPAGGGPQAGASDGWRPLPYRMGLGVRRQERPDGTIASVSVVCRTFLFPASTPDPVRLDEAVRRAVGINPALHSIYRNDPVRGPQYTERPVPADLVIHRELGGVTWESLAATARRTADREMTRRRDLRAGRLLRVVCLRGRGPGYALVVAIDHSVCDGMSFTRFLEDIADAYAASGGGGGSGGSEPSGGSHGSGGGGARGGSGASGAGGASGGGGAGGGGTGAGGSPAVSSRPSLAEVAAAEQAALGGAQGRALRAAWRARLPRGVPQVMLRHTRPWQESPPEAGSFTSSLHGAAYRRHTHEAAGLGMTGFALGAAKVLHAMRTAVIGDELAFFCPFPGRYVPEARDVVGNFANPLPVLVDAPRGADLPTTVRAVREGLLWTLQHQGLPFPEVLHEVRDVDATGGELPYMRRCVFLSGEVPDRFTLAGETGQVCPAEVDNALFDFSLWLYDSGEELRCHAAYRRSLLTRPVVEGWLDALRTPLDMSAQT
ncbi:hypothetical protein GCM10018793_01110 [Streptomyces sulfonofaciens]|uniref:Carrier domain-containing protein n=1 Tax=Streptomyces sulfonofaciens TaxID=68272 RepID=A0A919FMK3_9ACTN|nr:condensation domain-containing protein [Streptomyces sulfonofaciens]GHH69127.1 hypothetical protein GCM10018793_01110 [Streptomyces sulfonofaciens]